MNGFETIKTTDKARRDNIFHELRSSEMSLPEERQAVKYSDVEPIMLSEDEFALDEKNRVRYQTVFFVAYPKDIHGHRVRARVKREDERAEN